MTDPLEALRAPVEPIDPDPTFAARLREQVRRAVLNPVEATMSETTTTRPDHETARIGEPPWPPSLTPYVVVSDARRAMDWYVEVFGATRRGELHVNPDDSIGHAEIGLGDAVLMFAEASELYPDVPVAAPGEAPSTHSHSLHLQVDDVDATTRLAGARGARIEREPVDEPYGRAAVIVDPFGHRWMLMKPPGRATRHRHGEISYVTMVVADNELAKEFYGSVLGWEIEAGSSPNAWGPVGQHEFGVWSPPGQRPEVQLCYRVDDVEAAVRRVRAGGGQAGPVDRKPYGLMVECEDNQGAHFQLWQPTD